MENFFNPFKRSSAETASKFNYEIFDSSRVREEIFKICESLVNFVHENRVANIIAIDKSARPFHVGFREYWHHKFPGERIPNVYFMNPNGFVTDEETEYEWSYYNMKAAYKDDILDSEDARSYQEIEEDFKNTFKKLHHDKDKPVLIFDTCIHSGDSLKNILSTMEDAGFQDVMISVASNNHEAMVEIDHCCHDKELRKGCYPFDRDQAIKKTFSSVVSQRNNDVDMYHSNQIRKEIREIISSKISK
ncbi:MAG: hypothetical protein ACD_5C00244G0004 [uncultured bacterium]|nr:MAG: hypothetical protein ACD_5C00244G0004 [uncultured bacterium]